MQDFEKYEDMIPVYLSGKLDESEQAELESKLAESPELRAALDEFRHISVGLDALEAISGGHIDSELLIAYSDSPDNLDSRARQDLEQHLGECGECREELNLCRKVPEPNKFTSLLQWFLAPRVVLRPALIVTAICLLILPQVYMYSTRETSHGSVAELHLESAERGTYVNVLEIDPDNTVARLSFVIPVLDDRLYNFELRDSEGRLLFIKPNNPPKKTLALEIPSTYFQEGRYQLRIVELGVDLEPTDTFEFELDVRFMD